MLSRLVLVGLTVGALSLAAVSGPRMALQSSSSGHRAAAAPASIPGGPVPRTASESPTLDPDQPVDPTTGQYVRSVPIEVPAFFDVTPQVALRYNSAAGNGLLGVGWSLAASSSIVRTGRSGGAAAFDSSDTFYMDGSPLIACPADVADPACSSGGMFETSPASYRRINHLPDNSWRIESPDGLTSTYMPTALASAKGTYEWALTSVVDRHGNSVSYSYTADCSAECDLQTISYGSKGTNSGIHVRFYYGSRPDPLSLATGGGVAHTDRRLSSIVIDSNGSMVRGYAISYGSSQAGQSLVSAIKHFGRHAAVAADGTLSGPSLPAANFTVDFGPDTWEQTSLHGPRWPSYPTGPPLGAVNRPLTTNRNESLSDHFSIFKAHRADRSFVGDVNGDGRDDWVGIHDEPNDGMYVDVVVRGADGNRSLVPSMEQGLCSEQDIVLLGDVTGDGRADLIDLCMAKSNDAYYGPGAVTLGHIGIMPGLAAGGFGERIGDHDAMPWTSGENNEPTPTITPEREDASKLACALGDFDGIGRKQIGCFWGQAWGPLDQWNTYTFGRAHAAGKVTFGADGHLHYSIPWHLGIDITQGPNGPMGSPTPNLETVQAGDLNGDGLSDLVGNTGGGGIEVLLSHGTQKPSPPPGKWDMTSWARQDFFADVDGPGPQQFILTDVDGSGTDDVVETDRIGDVRAGLVSGSTDAVSIDWKATQKLPAGRTAYAAAIPGDVDGDGTSDLTYAFKCTAGDGTSGETVSHFLSGFHGEGVFYEQDAGPCRTWAALDTGSWVPTLPTSEDGNGDGLADTMLSWSGDDCVGYGARCTVIAEELSTPRGWDAQGYQPADVDGDGRTDLVYPWAGTDGGQPVVKINVERQETDGMFSGTTQTISVSDAMPNSGLDNRNWYAVDVGGPGTVQPDGRTDFVHVEDTADGIRVRTILANGATSWTQTTVDVSDVDPGAAPATSWRVGDIDGDGRADLYTVRDDTAGEPTRQFAASPANDTVTQTIYILRSTGGGNFSPVQRTDTTQPGIYIGTADDVLSTDVDGDGRMDLVDTRTATTYLSRGDRTFTAVSNHIPDSSLDSAAHNWLAGELNGDGRLDLLDLQATADEHTTATAYQSEGDGTFAAQPSATVSDSDTAARGWRITDIDHDGRDDLFRVQTSNGNDQLRTVRNEPSGWQSRDQALGAYGPHPWMWRPVDWNTRGDLTLMYVVYGAPLDGAYIGLRRYQAPPPRLIDATNGLGAAQSVTYGPADRGGSRVPAGLAVPVVASITTQLSTTDPDSTKTIERFSFKGPTWSYSQRRLRGFLSVGHNNDAQTNDVIQYQLDEACGAQPIRATISSGDGTLSATATTVYDEDDSFPHACLASHLHQETQTRGITGGSTDVSYTYDAAGNIRTAVETGEGLVATRTVASYAWNLDAYQLRAPYRQQTFSQHGSTWVKVAATRTRYDDPANPKRPGPLGEVRSIRQWDNDGNRWLTTTFGYTPAGSLAHVETPLNGSRHIVTKYRYDNRFGMYPTRACTLDRCTRATWNVTTGAQTSSTDVNRLHTATAYDKFGRVHSITVPDGTVDTYRYNGFVDGSTTHQIIQQHTPPGGSSQTTTLDLDGLARVVSAQTPVGTTSTNYYDGTSNRTLSTEEREGSDTIRSSAIEYDALGRPTFVRGPSGSSAQLTWRAKSVSTVDDLQQRRDYTFNARGDITAVKIGCSLHSCKSSDVTRYRYNSLGQMVSATDPTGRRTTWEWTSLGELKSACDPDAGCRTYEYFDSGSQRSSTDADGNTVDYGIDALGRPTSQTQHGADRTVSGTVQIRYDTDPNTGRPTGASLDKPTQLASSNGTRIDYGYDRFGRVSNERYCANARCAEYGYAYDRHGNLAAVTYPNTRGMISSDSETITYRYDALDRLSTVNSSDSATPLMAVTARTADGQVQAETLGGALTETRTISPIDHQLEGITLSAAQPLYQEVDRRDTSGRIFTSTVTNGAPPVSNRYGYGAANELKTVTSSDPSQSLTLNYDNAGNLTDDSRAGLLTYDPAHEHAPKTVGPTTVDYDLNGDARHAGTTSMTYTPTHQLATITTPKGTTRLTYWPTGDIATIRRPNGKREYRFGPLAEQGPAGWTTHIFASAEVAQRASGALEYLGHDVRGSVPVVTDASGAVLHRFNYDSFGSTTASDPAARYAGHRVDTVPGLVEMGARFYDPTIRHFLTADPTIPRTYDPVSLNHYTYAGNDPISRFDPTGLSDTDVCQQSDGSSCDNSGGQSVFGVLIAIAVLGVVTVLGWVFGGPSNSSAPANTLPPPCSACHTTGTSVGPPEISPVTPVQVSTPSTPPYVNLQQAQNSALAQAQEFAAQGRDPYGRVYHNPPPQLSWDERIAFAIEPYVRVTAQLVFTAPAFFEFAAFDAVSAAAPIEEVAGAGAMEGDVLQSGAFSADWEVIDEVPGGMVGQSTPTSCVSACGEVLSGGRISQTALIQELGAPAIPEELAPVLGPEWRGGYVDEAHLDQLLSTRRPWTATFREFGDRLGHNVIVDGTDELGRVIIRDPWNGGSTYKMTIQEFRRLWTGIAVFR